MCQAPLFPILMDKLCGKAVAARIQLLGCYMLYEVSGFSQISGMEMLYKTCGKTNGGGNGFQERRYSAFSSLESVIGSGNGGFYTTSYESMYGSSISGQIYLHRCFISYNYYSNGNPKPHKPSSYSSYSSPSFSSSSSSDAGNLKSISIFKFPASVMNQRHQQGSMCLTLWVDFGVTDAGKNRGNRPPVFNL